MLIFTLVCLIFLVGVLQSSVAGGNLAKGRNLVQKYCAQFHVIGNFNKFGGIGSTPFFRALRGMIDGMELLETFYTRRPYLIFVRVPNIPK